MSESILQEAQRIVDGARQNDYGHPLDNHGTTANMWNAFLSRKHGLEFKLDAEDVCMLNILQKISRQANRYTRDNLVDVAGYARNVEMVRNEREKRVAAVQALDNQHSPTSDTTGSTRST